MDFRQRMLDLLIVTPGQAVQLAGRDSGWTGEAELQRLPLGERDQQFWEERFEDIDARRQLEAEPL